MKLGRVLAAGLLLSSMAFSQSVTITAPANNTAATPGTTVNFTVTMSPASDFTAVSLSGGSPLGLIGAQASAASVNFSLALPANLQSASYPITAIGYSTAGALIISNPLMLLVGPGGTPVSLHASPAHLNFTSIGSQLPVLAGGTLANGTVEDLTVSPSLTWTSSNPSVATVSADGLVTSVGNGTATVTATVGSLSAKVAVTVSAPASACTYSLGSSSTNVAFSGGTATVNVTASGASCEWSAASWAPWVSVTAGALGAGSGSVSLNTAGNAGAARTATVSIAGQTFSLAQSAATGTVQVPAIANNGVVNGASFLSGGLVPGEIASIFGTNLTSANGINLASGLPLPTALLNVQVLVNGTAAPIFAVDNVGGQQQINFQVPYEIAGLPSATVQVIDNGVSGNTITAPVLGVQPGIFTFTAGSIVYGAILHADFSLANTSSPAVAGETVLIYCTGLGVVTSAPADGAAASGAANTTLTPTVSIGGSPAAVSYAGLAPGYVGLYQVNAAIPSGLASGNQPVVITSNGVSSPAAMLPIQ